MLSDVLNKVCKNIADIYLKVDDDSMSAICFRTTTKRNLPDLSYIICKPEPLGGELKTVACYFTGSLLVIKIHRVKEGMKKIKCHMGIG